MQRVTVSVGVLLFAGLVSAQAVAQNIPERARQELARNHHDPSSCSERRRRRT
jgi:hypothetical protein